MQRVSWVTRIELPLFSSEKRKLIDAALRKLKAQVEFS